VNEPSDFFITRVVPIGRDVPRRDVAHVFAVVGRFRERRSGVAHLPDPRLHRPRQVVDLFAGIVVVELAIHVPPLCGQHVGERVAERGLAGMPEVQRTRGVRRYELDHHAATGAGAAGAESGAAPMNVADHRLPRRRC